MAISTSPGAAIVLLALAVAGPVAAQRNLDFELAGTSGDPMPGWTTSGTAFPTVIESDATGRGARTLELRSTSADGAARVMQAIDTATLRGDRLKISANIKGELDGEGTGGLWVRVESEAGLLYVDSSRSRGDAPTSQWSRWVIEAPLAPKAMRVEFGADLRGAGSIWLDDFEIEALGTRTLPEPSAAAARYLERALDVIEQNSIQTATDWAAYRAAVRQQLRGALTIADAYLALRFAMSALEDGHSYFMTPRQMAALADEPVGNARTGRGASPPRGERLTGGIGYVTLPGFAGGTQADQAAFAEATHAVIRDLDTDATCGWILDLRDNSGGNLWPMLVGLGPLLGDGDAAISHYPSGERRPVWYRDGKAGIGDFVQLRVATTPHHLRDPEAPVAVLLGRATASSAEIVAAAFAARRQSRSFGSATRGATTGTRIFELGDGAALVLAVAATSDRNGRLYPGPIEPDERVAERARGEPLAEQAAVQAARAWLHEQPACAAPRRS